MLAALAPAEHSDRMQDQGRICDPVQVSRYEVVRTGSGWEVRVDLSSEPDEVWIDIFLDGVTYKPAPLQDMFPTFREDCIIFPVPSGHLVSAFAYIEDSVVYTNRARRNLGG
jgi:hypothetical protein